MLNFLRTYADCIVTSGKILRDEPFAFDSRVPAMLGLNQNVYFNENGKKPVAIMTDSLTTTLHETNTIYGDPKYRKLIFTKP